MSMKSGMNTICNIWGLAALVEMQARLAVMSNAPCRHVE